MSYKCNCNNKKVEPKKCPNSLCCNGFVGEKFNVAKAKTICGYIDRIFDTKEACASPLFHAISTDDTAEYESVLTLTDKNVNCCTKCEVGDASVFIVDNCPIVELVSLEIIADPTAAKVLVNGNAVTAVEITPPSDEFTVTLGDDNIIDIPGCEESEGKKSTIMLDAIGGWQYKANFLIRGVENFEGQACDFELSVVGVAPVETDTAETTAIIKDVCIPSKEATITFKIDGEASILNAAVAYTAGAAVLTGTVVIVPKITAEVIEKTKVCIQAMV